MELTKEEQETLYDYFMTCGYISHEFQPKVHAFINRLDEELNGPKGFTPIERTTND